MTNTHARVIAALVFVLASLALTHAADKPAAQPWDLMWGVKIPMRDGEKLNATVYRPHEQKDPVPVIFELTPYISDSYHERGSYFAQHGYVFAIVDVRGRGNSEGKFNPFYQEPQDGHDVVEWLATQPWSNGKVTMWGGSYAGFDQWMTLKEAPPHLMTIVPAAAAHVGVDFPMYKNVFSSYDIQWLTFTSGVTGNGNLFGDSAFWREKFGEMYFQHRPFKELDQIVGNTSTVFQDWLKHPQVDDYLKQLALTPEQYRAIKMPILTITASYDDDQPGAMTYYRYHMQYGNDEAKAKHYLIIGPWDHAGTRTPTKEVGGVTFSDAALVDLPKLHTEWYDWTMKSGAKPEFLKKRVAYYVMGADEWKYADTLEAVTRERRTLYLDSNGKANDVFHSGQLSASKPSGSASDQYVYDPMDTRPGELEAEDVKAYLTDQTAPLNLFGNGLLYQSDPMTEPTELSGFVKLVLWLSMDVPDTDLGVTLYEIRQDGTSIQLTTDLMRARYRESMSEAKLVKPGVAEKYEFSGFTFFSRQLAKGSRLRLMISSPNTRMLEKNYNSGGVVAEESGKDAKTAHVTLYHDAQRASYLELPIGK
jgi:putative CocE/NonD family hydrolase